MEETNKMTTKARTQKIPKTAKMRILFVLTPVRQLWLYVKPRGCHKPLDPKPTNYTADDYIQQNKVGKFVVCR